MRPDDTQGVVSWPDESWLPPTLQRKPLTRPFLAALPMDDRPLVHQANARRRQVEVMEYDPLG